MPSSPRPPADGPEDPDTLVLTAPARHRAPRRPVRRRGLALAAAVALLAVVALALLVAPTGVPGTEGRSAGAVPGAPSAEPTRQVPPPTRPSPVTSTPAPPPAPAAPAVVTTPAPVPAPAPTPSATPALPPPPPPAPVAEPCEAPGNSERARGNGSPHCP
ncbi:hypothetical protein SAMN05660464_3487 [Geodermatophilus dictyosporus]|uniref:Uncharacterized protein n=1 Tax=Geodermatophilus dictyosporus TaxID=1523247 RepID=A0A1I5R534_9ACTN|nr:hypothetical protein [Geodermatophilus dictyosporus]SFP53632.1 hypothetical protein SAMN05660464_3487 [Geodermatophilus dictyosporus]